MLAIVAIISLTLGQADRPPKLDFKTKIDYAAWINTQTRGKGENAMPRYAPIIPKPDGKGGLEGGIPDYDEAIRADITAYDGIWTKSDYPALAAYIEANGKYFDMLEDATNVGDCWDTIQPGSDLLDYKMPILSSVRNAGRARLARSWMKQDKQADAIKAAHRVHLRAARHMKQHSWLIAHLVALALRSEVYRSIRRAADADIIPKGEYAAWYSATADDDPGAPAWDSLLAIEFAVSLSSMQYVCPDGKHDPQAWKRVQELFREVRPLSDKEVATVMLKDPRQAVAAMESYHDALIEAGKGPYRFSNVDRIAEVWQEFEKQSKKSGNAFGTLWAANLTRCYQLIVRIEAERRGTMLVVAIHAHHAKHGKWPGDLGKIDGKLGLRNLKANRVDPMTGKRFLYRVEDDKPLLYSAGADGDDDNGTHNPKLGENGEGGDYVFWPLQTK